jgi:circadian clock protein KaiC
MTSWQATTFLIGEYSADTDTNPVFTVSDGLIWLHQSVERDSMVRKMQVVKMRGAAQKLGTHTFRIGSKGIHVFPRAVLQSPEQTARGHAAHERMSMGVPAIDEMMGGGVPAGYSLLLFGPSVSGKTIVATEFLAEGERLC